jgi:hypothetical protein
MKKPTNKEKIIMYERFIDTLALHADVGSSNLGRLINNASNWAYAHRVGNGELTEKQQEEIIAKKFWKLLDLENE